MMACNVYQTVKKAEISKKEINKVVNFVFKKLKKNQGSVSINLVGDRKIRSMNKKYRGIDKSTDVLSFAIQEGKSFKNKENDWGDIFLCVPQIERQAKSFKIFYKQEFVRILIHGILHLIGFDHQTKSEAKKMFAWQEKLVKKLGNKS